MSANKTGFSKVLEITYGDVDWKSPPKEWPLSSEEMLKFFFEKVLSLGVFNFIITPRSIGVMGSLGKEKSLPKICFDEVFLMREKEFFIRTTMKGGVIVVVSSGSDELMKLYENSGWVISNVSFQEAAGSISEYWDVKTLALISELGRKIFFFNHDADPVYFFE